MKPFYGRLCSPSAALTDFQYSLVEKALALAWDRHGQAAGATEVQSILMTELRDEPGEVDRQAWELGTQCWRRPKTEPLLRVVPTQN